VEVTSLTEDARDRIVAKVIRRGECPFGQLKPGQTIGHCPLGFPGCGCADELELNPYLQDLNSGAERAAKASEACKEKR